MPFSTKNIKQMNISELEHEMTRNHRMMLLYLNGAVHYRSDIDLTPETRQYYLKIKDMSNRLREMICDHIKIEQIPDLIEGPFAGKFTVKDILQLCRPFIQNKENFNHFFNPWGESN